jgi:hypothetical protein
LPAAFRTLAHSAKRIRFPVQEAAAAPCSSWTHGPLGVVDRDKMLRTDFCNQRAIHAPAKRSIPERGAFAATDRPRAL